MNHLQRQNLCDCGRLATLTCDWPAPERNSGSCDRPICSGCARVVHGRDHCPFHRGTPPRTEAEQRADGEAAANEAARIMGVVR